MMRAFLLSVVGFAAGVAFFAASPAPDAAAVTRARVVGAYRVKLRGDGWWRGTSSPYRAGRIAGAAILVFTQADPDDGKLHAAMQLDPRLTGSLVDLATPDPAAFVGSGYVVGDSLTILDTGTVVSAGGPSYVNALTIQFIKGGARLSGHWLTSYPASDPDAGPASAIGVTITGRRLLNPKARGFDAR